MGLKLNGATSGSIEIDVPAVAGTDTAITIPATTGGEFIVSDSSGNIDLGPLDINGGAADDSVNIDGSGRLLVGTSTARSNFFNSTISAGLQIEGTSSAGTDNRFIAHTFGGDDASDPIYIFAKHRGTTVGANTIVSDGDFLGLICFQGSDGSQFVEGAQIRAAVDGTPGADDMPGRLMFLTTSDGSSSATERMRIESTGRTKLFCPDEVLTLRSSTSASSSITGFNLVHSAPNITSGGTLAFIVRLNGDTLNINNSYGAISDIKLKENIVDASSQWNDLKAIQVRNYNFKEETGQQTHTQLGVVAQEIELVSPGLVTESPDKDAEGNDLGTTTKSVNYSVLYMKAVKALQEAMERIETLEAKVAQLEGGAA